MPKITERLLESLKPEAKERIIWDSELKGFGVRVPASGRLVFVVQYRNTNKRSRRLTLGPYGQKRLDEYRQEARNALSAVFNGHDPVENERILEDAPSISRLMDEYIKSHVMVHYADTTRKVWLDYINGVILKDADLKGLKVKAVERKHIASFHRKHSATPRKANMLLTILSKAFSLAEVWGWRDENTNPCRKVEKYKENHRERYLTMPEVERLEAVLDRVITEGLPWLVDEAKPQAKHLAKPENRWSPADPQAIAAIWLLLFTGARLSEILTLKWEHVDLVTGTIALPDRKGKARRPHPVSSHALAVLATLPRNEGQIWVLPHSSKANEHIEAIKVQSTWRRIRALAGIEDVNLHDLRHTVGTMASILGGNSFTIRDMLRHSNVTMTSRYANRADDPVRALSEAVGDRLNAALKRQPSAEVIPLHKKA